jgi:hypothetical protein
MSPPGPVTDLPLRPVAVSSAPSIEAAAGGVAKPAASVVTPVRAPSKASGSWVIGVMGASVAATVVAASLGGAPRLIERRLDDACTLGCDGFDAQSIEEEIFVADLRCPCSIKGRQTP